MDPLTQATAFLDHVQQHHPDDRMAVFYHINEQAESPQQATLALSLFMIKLLKQPPKHDDTIYAGFYESLLPLASRTPAPHDKTLDETYQRLRPVSKQLIKNMIQRRPSHS